MRYAIDTSVLVAFFLEEDKFHKKSVTFMDKIFNNEIDYACLSAINISETGYVIERATNNENYAYNCMYSLYNEIPVDIITLSWDFIVTLAHLKAINPISFCDNATIAAANLTRSKALFTREKEFVGKSKITGSEIVFLEDIIE